MPPLWGLAVVLRNGKPGADAPRLYDITASRLGKPAPVEVLVHLPAQQKQGAQASQDDAIKINFSPRQDRAASPCLPQVLRFVASGRQRPLRVTSKTVLARKWRPPFFLLCGAKKVGRHKSSHINGLCLEAPAPSTKNGAFAPSKNRHSPPFFDDSAWVCPRAHRTIGAGSTISGGSDRSDRLSLRA